MQLGARSTTHSQTHSLGCCEQRLFGSVARVSVSAVCCVVLLACSTPVWSCSTDSQRSRCNKCDVTQESQLDTECGLQRLGSRARQHAYQLFSSDTHSVCDQNVTKPGTTTASEASECCKLGLRLDISTPTCYQQVLRLRKNGKVSTAVLLRILVQALGKCLAAQPEAGGHLDTANTQARYLQDTCTHMYIEGGKTKQLTGLSTSGWHNGGVSCCAVPCVGADMKSAHSITPTLRTLPPSSSKNSMSAHCSPVEALMAGRWHASF